MNWFAFSLITMLAWGAADLFYKKGSVESDRYSHLKTSVMVGVVMGLHAFATLLFGNIGYQPINLVLYLPVSLMYILSMTVGYFGERMIETLHDSGYKVGSKKKESRTRHKTFKQGKKAKKNR